MPLVQCCRCRVADRQHHLNLYNVGWLDNQTKGLVMVEVVLLREASNNPMSLVAGKRAIRVELVFEYPLARHNVGARGRGTRRQLLLSMSA
jgi:hypothetical protein